MAAWKKRENHSALPSGMRSGRRTGVGERRTIQKIDPSRTTSSGFARPANPSTSRSQNRRVRASSVSHPLAASTFVKDDRPERAGLIDAARGRHPLHQRLSAGIRAYRKAAANHLAEGDEIGADAEAAGHARLPDAETGNHFIED